MFRYIISCLLLLFSLTGVHITALAQPMPEQQELPVRTGTVSNRDFPIPGEANCPKAAEVRLSDCVSKAEAVSRLHSALKNHETEICISMACEDGDAEAMEAELFRQAASEDDRLNWLSRSYSVSGFRQGDLVVRCFSWTVNYLTDPAQEKVIDEAVSRWITELKLDGCTDYQKLRCIYESVRNSIRYDYNALADMGNTLKYSAYTAVTEGKTVSHGFSDLMDRMLEKIGLECRRVYGIAEGMPRSWNLVKLGESWYCMDVSDDVEMRTMRYFLQSEDVFYNHFPYSMPELPMASQPRRETLSAPQAQVRVEGPSVMLNWQSASDGFRLYEVSGGTRKCIQEGEGSGTILTAVADGDHTYLLYALSGGTESDMAAILDAAVDAPSARYCGSSMVWDLAEGTLTLRGTGAMADYTVGTAPWYAHRQEIQKVVFSDQLTRIGSGAFAGCACLTEVILPETLTGIGTAAFRNCASLKTLELPANVSTVGDFAFLGCQSLDGLCVSEQSTAFQAVEGALLSYDGSIFLFCPPTVSGSYTLPETVTVIAENAFDGCTELTEVVFSEHLTEIWDGAFHGCTGLNILTLPAELTELSRDAFTGCANLISVTAAPGCRYRCFDGAVYLDDTLFLCPEGMEGSFTVPFGTAEIGYMAFRDCGKLTGMTVPATVSAIREEAFENASFRRIVFLGAAPEMESSSFAGVQARAEYDANTAGWTEIQNETFGGSLVWAEGGRQAENGRSGYCGEQLRWELREGTLTVTGIGAMEGYTAWNHAPWQELQNEIQRIVIEDGVTLISGYAFYGCAAEELSLPGSVASIGEYAFASSNLKSVEIPEGVESVAERAFHWCSMLETASLPASVEAIGAGAFSRCISLREIAVAEENPEFRTWNGLLLSKDMRILHQCPAGRSAYIDVPFGVKVIAEEAFGWCEKMENVALPYTTEEIGANAFYGCVKLQYMVIPPKTTKIGTGAFLYTGISAFGTSAGNTAYISLDGVLFSKSGKTLICFPPARGGIYALPEKVTKIGAAAFYGCGRLTAVRLNEALTTIGRQAFFECSGLTELTIPENLLEIKKEAFGWCDGLKTIVFSGYAPQIDTDAFYGCAVELRYPENKPGWDKLQKKKFDGSVLWTKLEASEEMK